jgi:hypothetical protein
VSTCVIDGELLLLLFASSDVVLDDLRRFSTPVGLVAPVVDVFLVGMPELVVDVFLSCVDDFLLAVVDGDFFWSAASPPFDCFLVGDVLFAFVLLFCADASSDVFLTGILLLLAFDLTDVVDVVDIFLTFCT